MSSKTKYAKILTVIIVAVVVIGGFGGYYLAKRPNTSIPSTTPSLSPLQTGTPTPASPSTSSASPIPTPPLALDGSGSGIGNVVSLTTKYANDILYLSIATSYNADPPNITSTPVLTWTQRSVATYTNGIGVYTFYAITTSSGVISITVPSDVEDSDQPFVVFAVSGANTADPFDTMSGNTASGVSNSARASISTTNANDFVIGTLGVSAGSSLTVAQDSSFTLIKTQSYGVFTNGARQTSDEYKTVSATGTYTPTFALSDYFSWVMVADAIKKAP